MKDGFIKVSATSPRLCVAGVVYNCRELIGEARAAAARGVKLLVFPELSITGYTSADLFLNSRLLSSAEEALGEYIDETSDLDLISFVGVPVSAFGRLYNCAAAVFRGRLLGLVAKSYIPNHQEFSEARYFSPAPKENADIVFAGQRTVLGNKLIFVNTTEPKINIGCEICQDLWGEISPSSHHAAAGANVIVNPSASDELVSKADYRRSLVSVQSAKTVSAYIYANSGVGESTTDMVFSAHNIIAERGKTIAEALPFADCAFTVADIDVERICQERRRLSTFVCERRQDYAYIEFAFTPVKTELESAPPRQPFVPADDEKREKRCTDVLEIQSRGLAARVERAHAKSMVVGVSGGLDSTLAMLVCARACDIIGMPRERITAVTMPGFGTTGRTRENAERLADSLGATLRTVDIRASVEQHLRDIGHDGVSADVTFENAQARERTQILMDIANSEDGLVVGTGDLSELALGYATYNGDHMSMYAVNSSVPKTLLRHIVYYCLVRALYDGNDVLATPVSPELLPAADGEIAQRTEEIVGPYELHDYFLYYTLRCGFSPEKIFRLATLSFDGKYDAKTILKWQRVFTSRFFSQQFKRSCLPDGPKVGTVSVSPRGDLRMPSDADASLWLSMLDSIEIN